MTLSQIKNLQGGKINVKKDKFSKNTSDHFTHNLSCLN